MPNYVFKNKTTNEIVEHSFSYKEYDQFLIDNPDLERYHSPENLPGMGEGIRMNTPGIGKPDSTFEKYVINRIKESVPGNTIGKYHKTKIPKEI